MAMPDCLRHITRSLKGRNVSLCREEGGGKGSMEGQGEDLRVMARHCWRFLCSSSSTNMRGNYREVIVSK